MVMIMAEYMEGDLYNKSIGFELIKWICQYKGEWMRNLFFMYSFYNCKFAV